MVFFLCVHRAGGDKQPQNKQAIHALFHISFFDGAKLWNYFSNYFLFPAFKHKKMFTFAGKLHINNFSCIMANVIKIKKGLDINLKGKASEVLLNSGKSETYAIVPDYYNGIVPKVVAKPGEKVKAGSVLMIDKNRP